MHSQRFITRIRKNQCGATAVEFAIVSGAFFMLLFGIIEYGLIMYTKVAVETIVQQSARDVSIGKVVPGCVDRACSIRRLIEQRAQGLINPESAFVNATVVTNNVVAASPPVPDVCLADVRTPYPPVCLGAWEENSGNPTRYDPPAALNNVSLGQAGDLVEIRVTYLWRVVFPIFQERFGDHGVLTITSSTVMKNQPFGP